jgi:hypothetical protein
MSKFSICLLLLGFFLVSTSSTNTLYGQTYKAKIVNKVKKLTPKQYEAMQKSDMVDVSAQLEKIQLKDGKAVLHVDKSKNRMLILEKVGKEEVQYAFTDLKGNHIGGDLFSPPVMSVTKCYMCCCTPRQCDQVPCDDIVIVNED